VNNLPVIAGGLIMVGIFTGLGAGFERGSGAALGGAGLLGSSALGRSGEGVFLNALTGNFLINRQDEFLVGRGPDVAISRTYNSLGALDENGDNWRQSTDRRVFGVAGALNVNGSTVRRVSADGSDITYTYRTIGSVSAYWATDGAGAHDKLTISANIWTWTDGDSQAKEVYQSNGSYWQITEQSDRDGNKITFSYTGDKLQRATTQDGGYTEYKWSGNNITSIVTGYADLSDSGAAKTLTRTRYGYDTSNRLTSVTVDLSPQDNVITDGAVYTTNYEYDGVSKRVSSIKQTDGSRLDLVYFSGGANDGKLKQLVQHVSSSNFRTTNIEYFGDRTQLSDDRGAITNIYADGTGSFGMIIDPVASTGQAQTVAYYNYDAEGNVTRSIDPSGSVTHFSYDARGNMTQSKRYIGVDTPNWDPNVTHVRRPEQPHPSDHNRHPNIWVFDFASQPFCL
jgi:YD repeat-containing protein